MKKLNIHDKGLYYIEGIVRSLIKDDDEKYQLARKAYVSMLRAYLFIYSAMPNLEISRLSQ